MDVCVSCLKFTFDSSVPVQVCSHAEFTGPATCALWRAVPHNQVPEIVLARRVSRYHLVDSSAKRFQSFLVAAVKITISAEHLVLYAGDPVLVGPPATAPVDWSSRLVNRCRGMRGQSAAPAGLMFDNPSEFWGDTHCYPQIHSIGIVTADPGKEEGKIKCI